MIGTFYSPSLGYLKGIRESGDYHFIAATEPHLELLERPKANPRSQGIHRTSVAEILTDD